MYNIVSKIITVFLLLFFTSGLFAQIDSLKNLIEKSDNDTLIIKSYIKLSDEFKNQDSTLFYFNKAIDYAKDNNITEEYYNSQYELAKYYISNQAYSKSNQVLDTALKYALVNEDYEHIYRFYARKGMTYRKVPDYEKALEAYNLALELAKEQKDTFNMTMSYNAIGQLFKDNDLVNEAIDATYYAYRLSKSLDKPFQVLKAMNQLGLLYHRLENYDSAYYYYDKTYKLSKEKGSKRGMAIAASNFGRLYFDQGKMKESLDAMLETHQLLTDLKDYPRLGTIKNNIGYYYIKNGDINKGLEYLYESRKLANQTDNKTLRLRIYENLALAYSKQGKYKDAFEIQEKLISLTDSIQTQKMNEAVAMITKKFDFQLKEEEREQAFHEERMKQEAEKEIIKRRNLYITLGLIISFLFIVILTIMNNNIRRKNKKLKLINAEMELLNDDLSKAKDQAILADKAKSSFLANMSHEIRTPMNGIIGMCDVLAQSELSKSQSEYNEIIMKSANNLLNIINDILDFSKIEAGKMKIDAVPTNIFDVINDVTDVTAIRAENKSLNYAAFTDVNIKNYVLGDPLRIRQILINLCNNAIKFTEDGEVFVSCELIKENEEFVWIKFSVKDTGIGISQEDQDKLFKAFTQIDSTTSRKFEGTGLGLNISYKLVEKMGGELKCESEEDIGSDFFFELKLKKLNERPEENLKLDLSNLKVLCVDDNKTNLKIFDQYFKFWNCNIDLFSKPEDALERLKKTKYDLIITDHNMPVMSGLEFLQELKRLGISQKTKVIFASSVTTLVENEKKGLNIDLHLVKPIKLKQLKTGIKVLLNKGKSDKEKSAKTEDATAVDEKPKLKILLAEDNVINMKVALIILSGMGHEVVVAKNGVEAVDRFKSDKELDLILMDIHMPDMDGVEATREIRKIEKDEGHKKNIKIVALTANALKGDKEKFMSEGMDDYISKPFKQDDINKIEEKHFK